MLRVCHTLNYTDALGRETNSVRCVWRNGSRDSAYAPLSTRTAYPYGTGGYTVTADPLGVQTVTRTYYEGNAEITEAASAGVTNRTIRVRGGATVEEKFWDGKWTRETRSTAYDTAGRRVETVTAEASDCPVFTKSVTVYDFLGREVSVATPLNVTSNFYDGASDRVIRMSRTGSPDTLYVYDALGNVTATALDVDGDGQVSVGDESDENVALYALTDLGLTSGIAWWFCDISIRREAGRAVTNSVVYTRQNEFMTGMTAQTVSENLRGARTAKTAYFDAATCERTETIAYAYATNLEVRVLMFGQSVSQKVLNGSKTSYLYDGFGRQTGSAVSGPGETSLSSSMTAYHPEGALAIVSKFLSDGQTNSTVYSQPVFTPGGGYTQTVANAAGGWRTGIFDALGNKIAESGMSAYPLGFGYDTRNRLAELQTVRDNESPDSTRWLVDFATGLVTCKVFTSGARLSYLFGASGKLAVRESPSGQEAHYAYTSAGRRASVSYTGTAFTHGVSNMWNGSLLARVDDAQGPRLYAYDGYGTLAGETNAFTSMTYAHDIFGRVTVLNVGACYSAGYGYEEASGRTISSTFTDGTITQTFDLAYAPATDFVCGIAQRGGGFCSLRAYDSSCGVLLSVSNFWNGALVSSFSYTHDTLNRCLASTDVRSGTLGTVTNGFSYNGRSEITNAMIRGIPYAYGYDRIGNRLWSTGGGETNVYATGSLNQYVTVTNAGIDVPITYDANCNMTRFGLWAYAWDGENNMRIAVPVAPTNGSVRVINGYDFMNRRFRKTVEALTGYVPSQPPAPPGDPGEWIPLRVTDFVWDGWNIAAEFVTENGATVTNLYYWCVDVSGTKDGAHGVGGLRMASFHGIPAVYCYDGNGNVTELLHADTGEILARYEYDPFGRATTTEGPLAEINPWRFATRYHDRETGLVMFPRRPYSAELGRFLSQDPAGEDGGYNLHAYCENNPVNSVDPLGKAETDDRKVDFEGQVSWRYEVQYRWGVLYSLQYKDVPQSLPGEAPYRRRIRSSDIANSDNCLFKARKLVVWAEPANGFSTVWTDEGKLRFEPMIAFTESATENTDGQWQPTWSQLGALRYDGFNMSSTGQYLTFVNRVWPESTSKLTLYVHRKIVRRTVLVGADNDLEQVLPVLAFRLVKQIGGPP